MREALVAVLGTLDGFRVVAEADSDEAALEAARSQRPRLALIEPELSGCAGWWTMKRMQAEQLVGVVVALGRKGNCGGLARAVGAQAYVQMGSSPRDFLDAIQAATAILSGAAEAQEELLANSHAVVDEPALVDL